jgi:hypothetical protein
LLISRSAPCDNRIVSEDATQGLLERATAALTQAVLSVLDRLQPRQG